MLAKDDCEPLSQKEEMIKEREMWEACLPPRALVMSGSRAAAKGHIWVHGATTTTISICIHVVTKGHKDAQCLGCPLGPCRCLRVVPGAWFQDRTDSGFMSGSMALPQPEFEMMSLTPVTIKTMGMSRVCPNTQGHVSVQESCCRCDILV